MSHDPFSPSRRKALQCLAFGGAGTLFTLSGGVLTPINLAQAREQSKGNFNPGKPLFVQVSDTHIGFHKEANPDPAGTLNATIRLINGMADRPALVLHTGDITHLSKPEEFDQAQAMLSTLRAGDLHTTPGEHDVVDSDKAEYFHRFGKISDNKGYYSFDAEGVHFVALTNVLQTAEGGLGRLGDEQLSWVHADLRDRSSSTPIVVFAHMPLWSVYQPWGWGTIDAAPLIEDLRRFGSVTVLNGHIHQIVQKVEGHIIFHTARSTAYPQPAPGEGPGPGPLKVPPDQLTRMLGLTAVTYRNHSQVLQLEDQALG